VRSLLLRIMVFFIAVNVMTVIVLTVVANYQIYDHFGRYIHMHQGNGVHGMMGLGPMMMGRLELEFIQSLRSSLLLWAGVMIAVGAAVSYYLARTIAKPVIKLNQAVHSVAQGNLDAKVSINRQDEVGQLANSFNEMTGKLKLNSVLRQRFLAGVAHEIRTPLTILKANLEGMADGVIKPDKEHIDSLNEEVDRLTKMVGDLRELSLLEAGQIRLEFGTVAINGVIRNIAAKLKPLADDKQLVIKLELSDAVQSIWADSVRVGQMLYNLVMNAIQYTGAGGSITISTALAGTMVEIRVADTGIGIAPDDVKHVFDHFYRADPSRTKQSGGTGLGLAIVRQLALAHQGHVSATSTPGQGSTFILTLPVGPYSK